MSTHLSAPLRLLSQPTITKELKTRAKDLTCKMEYYKEFIVKYNKEVHYYDELITNNITGSFSCIVWFLCGLALWAACASYVLGTRRVTYRGGRVREIQNVSKFGQVIFSLVSLWIFVHIIYIVIIQAWVRSLFCMQRNPVMNKYK